VAQGDVSTPGVPAAGRPPARTIWSRIVQGVRDYFGEDISFTVAVVPYCFLSMILFTRHPMKTNFIFDEQEALLANPYVRSIADAHPKFLWRDAFRRDFWGLPPEHSIGSYRPIPDLIWRALWAIGARDQTPFLHHWVNVLLHGVNGALVALIVARLTRDRFAAWLSGTLFVACAVVTEAVSGVVGIADVLGGTGALLALMTLALRAELMMPALFAATLFGLFSKESALCIVPLVPFAALAASPLLHQRPRRVARALMAALSTGSAFVLYVELRKRWFPAPLSAELSPEAIASKHGLEKVYATVLRWYAQPALPRDPLNNPLADAHGWLRIAGALRVYARGFLQVLVPLHLSGDYSAPQEPIPDRVVFPESVLGALLAIGPFLVALWLLVRSWRRDQRDSGDWVGVALVWIVVSYFPVSNIPVVLPTVRAERFWYFPAIATSMLLGVAFARMLRWPARIDRRDLTAAPWALFTAFLLSQCLAARKHANDYKDDLAFWDATRHAVPRSAKAHLNYSVMQGARGNLEERLAANRVALELAPKWPMANVYLGDTLCRLHRAEEAWPYYAHGFELAPNEPALVALGVQCLWDEHLLEDGSAVRDELEDMSEKQPGSWLDVIVRDTLANGAEHSGVDPKYRPRGYNEGPKNE
jgi:tetratricopeptide (TPR) repeat protein